MEKIKDAISIKINSGDKAFISLYKSISVFFAMILATVVLPTPGGP